MKPPSPQSLHLKLPATSANLGPGFDTLAIALGIFLEVDARPAPEFSIQSSGRNRELCGSLNRNLMVETYRGILDEENRPVVPLSLIVNNGIPLGMGCGSSAAARLAGIALANHFGSLQWNAERIVQAAAEREGHPDNVAGCWYGGLTIAGGQVAAPVFVSIAPPSSWSAVLVIPEKPVPTEDSRAVLPETYAAADAVVNVQNVALMTAAFALARPDLVTRAAADRLHQPYREKLCPLLPLLLPLAGQDGILSVTLSGAGPSVLLLLGPGAETSRVRRLVGDIVQPPAQSDCPVGPAEILGAGLSREGAQVDPDLG